METTLDTWLNVMRAIVVTPRGRSTLRVAFVVALAIHALAGAQRDLDVAAGAPASVEVTTDSLRVRTSPSLSASVTAVVHRGRLGTLIDFASKRQDGFVWRYVSFPATADEDGVAGWVAEGDDVEPYIVVTVVPQPSSADEVAHPSRVPYRASPGTAPLEVHAGSKASYMLMSDGTIAAWGYEWGPVATLVPDIRDAATMSAGYDHVLVARVDGTVVAWGRNDRGQLGLGHALETSGPVPVRGLENVVAVSAGRYLSLALTAEGDVWSWGDADFLKGIGHEPSVPRHVTPTRLVGVGDVVAIAAGFGDAYARTTDGTVWHWKMHVATRSVVDATGSRVGWSGSLTRREIDLHPPGAITVDRWVDDTSYGIATLPTGSSHTVLFHDDGRLTFDEWSWSQPEKVEGLDPVVQLAASDLIVVALTREGEVYAWTPGRGVGDRMGLSTIPTRVPLPDRARLVEAGGRSWEGPPGDGVGAYAFAVTDDGRVWAWGAGVTTGPWEAGVNLGTGIAGDKHVPHEVADVRDVTFLSSGSRHTVALMPRGPVVGWGENRDGQVGDGTTVPRWTASRVGSLGREGASITTATISPDLDLRNDEAFFVAENGVTIMCPDAAQEEYGRIGDEMYTKRSIVTLTRDNAATACTTGIPWMARLFENDREFDAPIGHWDTSSVTSMSSMFANAVSFDRDIGSWDVRAVTDTSSMFAGARSFDQDLTAWRLDDVVDITGMFEGATAFNPENAPAGARGDHLRTIDRPPAEIDLPRTGNIDRSTNVVADPVIVTRRSCRQAVYVQGPDDATGVVGIDVSTELDGIRSNLRLLVRVDVAAVPSNWLAPSAVAALGSTVDDIVVSIDGFHHFEAEAASLVLPHGVLVVDIVSTRPRIASLIASRRDQTGAIMHAQSGWTVDLTLPKGVFDVLFDDFLRACS